MLNYREEVLGASTTVAPFFAHSLKVARPWLDRAISPPIAAEIELVINGLRNKQPEYEPLLFDYYLGEASAALDRCLALRKEIQGLELLALDFARRYERSARTRAIDAELDNYASQSQQMKKLGDSYVAASKQFKGSDKDALARQSEALGVSSREGGDSLQSRSGKLAERWKIVGEIDTAEEAQHDIPGHSLNFGERRERLVELLTRDLAEAVKKLITVQEGIKVIYGPLAPTTPLPGPGITNVLDRLVFWTRDVIEFLERQYEHEIEFDLVIPMNQKSVDRDGAELGMGITAAIIFNKSEKKTFAVRTDAWLSKVFISTQGKSLFSSLRLKGVGASISNGTPDEVDQKTAIFNVVVFPPVTPRALDASMTDWLVRPPILLGDVRPTRSEAAVAMEYGAAAHNQRVVGEWNVRVLHNVASATEAAKSKEELGATDLKLHLRVIGLLANDHTAW